MNKKVNKTTSRKEQLNKLHAVKETDSQKTDNSRSRSRERSLIKKKNNLLQHNPDLSGSQDGMANATDEDEILAR